MHFKLSIYTFILFLLLNSCNKEEHTPEPVDRTVLVYIAGENSLNQYVQPNLQGMIKGAAGGNLNGGNLLVYIDQKNALPQLLKITQDKNGEIIKEVIRDYQEEHNSASVSNMQKIIDETMKLYPAKSNGLILWSHGTAWLEAGYPKNSLRSFGEDEVYSAEMELYELKEALAGKKFDFILFDACYMASIEVVYALKDNADYILASPTEVLGNGMPYEYIVEYLFSRTLTVEQFLEKTGEIFYNYYDQRMHGNTRWPRSASTCLVKTQHLPQLAVACREILNGKIEELSSTPRSQLQRMEYLKTNFQSLYDFEDFISYVGTTDNFTQALNAVVIYKKTTEQAYFANNGHLETIHKYSGLSVYVPQNQYPLLQEWYTTLDWYKAVYQ